MKPHFDFRYGIWRCWLRGTRLAGFGRTVRQAWQAFMTEVRNV